MFADTLEIKILLTVDKKTIAIPGGNVKSLKVDLLPYGFTSILTFVVSGRKKEKDLLFPFFVTRDLMKARVALKPRWQEDKVEPLVVQGLVTAVAPSNRISSPAISIFPITRNPEFWWPLTFTRRESNDFSIGEEGRAYPYSQGNHMLLGKSEKSQASLKHVYVDDKPVLEMKRTSGKDSEMIKMIEGSLILETKEE